MILNICLGILIVVIIVLIINVCCWIIEYIFSLSSNNAADYLIYKVPLFDKYKPLKVIKIGAIYSKVAEFKLFPRNRIATHCDPVCLCEDGNYYGLLRSYICEKRKKKIAKVLNDNTILKYMVAEEVYKIPKKHIHDNKVNIDGWDYEIGEMVELQTPVTLEFVKNTMVNLKKFIYTPMTYNCRFYTNTLLNIITDEKNDSLLDIFGEDSMFKPLKLMKEFIAEQF